MRYRQLIELSSDTIFIIISNKIAFVNRAGLSLLGANHRDQLINRSIYDCIPIEHHEEFSNKMAQALAKNISTDPIAENIIRLDGTLLDVQVVRSSYLYMNCPEIHIVMRDITLQNQMQLEIEIENSIIMHLVRSNTLMEANLKIIETIAHKLIWDLGVYFSNDTDESFLRCCTAWQKNNPFADNKTNDFSQMLLSKGDSLAGSVWETQTHIWLTDLAQATHFSESFHPSFREFQSALGFPITHDDEVLGIIMLFSRERKPPGTMIKKILTSVANQLGFFIKHQNVEKQINYIKEHDCFTGLYNRFYIEKVVSEKIDRNTLKKQFSLFLFNIDHIDRISKGIGNQGWDLVLKGISDRLLAEFSPNNILARLESDEFAIVNFETENKAQVLSIIKKIQEIFLTDFIIKKNKFQLTISMGISLYPNDGVDIKTLLTNAHSAMKQIKKTGGNAFQFYSPEMTLQAKKRLTLEQELKAALKNNEFVLYYQPKLGKKVNAFKILGMEVLIRWQKIDDLILPDEFIPIAEDSGLIVPLSEWTLATACEFHRKLLKQRLIEEDFSMAVNISARQFREPNFCSQLISIIEEKELNPKNFELELTESMLMDPETVLPIFAYLKKLGVKLSIDDFGTGYSSFSYLQSLYVDYLKIDKSFIKNIENENTAVIVDAMVSMGKKLGIKVVAESVETNDQVEILNRLDCDEMQGYLFSRPLPEEAFLAFIKSRGPSH